ncbi:MAG TPA: hypothetical protein DCE41_01070, partial [Cytophagales bacterium]|nr:hypothetical protein [Cytophagales bacterium]
MDRNTDGRNSSHDVYSPADWVLHFETYMNYILDGIKLVVDTAAFIASEGEDAEAAVDAVKDAFALGKDAAEAKAKHDAENANYDKLTHLTSR